jgi:hypothetical protein
MAAAATMSRQSPLNEDDLQHLYNEVWAGFVDEPPSANTPDTGTTTELESLYGAYGSDDDPTRLPTRKPTTGACARLSIWNLPLLY